MEDKDATIPDNKRIRHEILNQDSQTKPSEPRIGTRLIVNIILRWNNKARLCRVLLDWGVSIPIQNVTWATRNKVPTFEREKPLQIESLTGKTETDIGKTYTYPMRLQHRKHVSVESFYITPMEPDCDVILPFW
jgi:hypothetical protein